MFLDFCLKCHIGKSAEKKAAKTASNPGASWGFCYSVRMTDEEIHAFSMGFHRGRYKINHAARRQGRKAKAAGHFEAYATGYYLSALFKVLGLSAGCTNEKFWDNVPDSKGERT